MIAVGQYIYEIASSPLAPAVSLTAYGSVMMGNGVRQHIVFPAVEAQTPGQVNVFLVSEEVFIKIFIELGATWFFYFCLDSRFLGNDRRLKFFLLRRLAGGEFYRALTFEYIEHYNYLIMLDIMHIYVLRVCAPKREIGNLHWQHQ